MTPRYSDRWHGEVGYQGLRQVRKGKIRWRRKTITLPADVLDKLGEACEVIVKEEDELLHFSLAEYPGGTKYRAVKGMYLGKLNWWAND